MKEIRMEYREYQNMVKTIESQEKIIEDFKKSKNVILIDERYDYYSSRVNGRYGIRVPRIICDPSVAKIALKTEFENLQEKIKSIQKKIEEDELNNRREELNKKKKSWFWNF